jgi:hypothetical protein
MTVFGKQDRMVANASKTDLMRSLGQLVRGLSALFWGLPVALVLSAQAVTSNLVLSLGLLGLVGPGLAHAVLLYGLWLMGSFQAQERIWVAALDRARLFSLLNVGLSPFLHWHQRAPDVAFFAQSAAAMGVSSLCFLFCLNRVLRRLAAMLPDETLRVETAVFTTLNLSLLVILPTLLGAYLIAIRIEDLPVTVRMAIQLLEPVQHWLVLFLVLLPVAVTMSLIWKIKEAVFSCVFEESPRH